jgi:hypothetical protein
MNMHDMYQRRSEDARALNFSEERASVTGRMQVVMMKGAKPTIIGADIVIDPTKTQIVGNYMDKNLVVDEGRLVLNQTMAGEIPADPIAFFCTGIGGYIGTPDPNVDPNPPLGTDQNLYNPFFQKAITSIDHPNSLATTFITVVEELESNASLTEFGLKTASGRLFARRTTRPMWKDSNVFFVCRWTIQF